MVRDWLKTAVYAGHIGESSAEVRKQIILSSLFSLISVVFLVLFGLENLRYDNNQLATVVLSAALVSGCNYLFLFKTGKYRTSSLIIVIMMTALCIYLVCSGGRDNSGPLWMFVLPGLIFYILGLIPGLMYLSLLLGLICFILLVPHNALLNTVYPTVFIYRFLGAMFAVSIMAFVYEYSREDGRKELLNLSRRLDSLSRKDDLTKLSNRRDMFERLRNELGRLERSGKIFSVLLADIDKFKQINDTYGHECGDYSLKEIAGVLSENTQKRDTVARWGGEEFLVFLPETEGKQAALIGERLRMAVENFHIRYKEERITITMSIGVAQYQPGQTLNALINRADKQLYLAKRNGRNRVEFDH